MNAMIARKLITSSLLSLCVAVLAVQAQTASPGPPSRNANVDKEDPNKPDTPQHEIPNQEAPGSSNNDDRGAAAESTPSGSDGSTVTEPWDPTQPIPRGSAEQNATNSDEDQGRSTPAGTSEPEKTDSGDDQPASTSTPDQSGAEKDAGT